MNLFDMMGNMDDLDLKEHTKDLINFLERMKELQSKVTEEHAQEIFQQPIIGRMFDLSPDETLKKLKEFNKTFVPETTLEEFVVIIEQFILTINISTLGKDELSKEDLTHLKFLASKMGMFASGHKLDILMKDQGKQEKNDNSKDIINTLRSLMVNSTDEVVQEGCSSLLDDLEKELK